MILYLWTVVKARKNGCSGFRGCSVDTAVLNIVESTLDRLFSLIYD